MAPIHGSEYEKLVNQLQDLVDQMKRDEWLPIRGFILIARDSESDMVTYCPKGDVTGLLQDAWKHKRGDA